MDSIDEGLPLCSRSFRALRLQYERELANLRTGARGSTREDRAAVEARVVDTQWLLDRLDGLAATYKLWKRERRTHPWSCPCAFTAEEVGDLRLLGFDTRRMTREGAHHPTTTAHVRGQAHLSGTARSAVREGATGEVSDGYGALVAAQQRTAAHVLELVQQSHLIQLRLSQLAPVWVTAVDEADGSARPREEGEGTPAAPQTPTREVASPFTPSEPSQSPSPSRSRSTTVERRRVSRSQAPRPLLSISERVRGIVRALRRDGQMPDLSPLSREELVELKALTSFSSRRRSPHSLMT